MEKLSYKTFTWPHNPHTYHDSFLREPRYRPVGEDMQFAGMSLDKRTITGRGVFFGAGAYENFAKLIKLFEDPAPGYLEHSVWGRCYCYLTSLELTQEPRENYVSYSFTFTGAQPGGEVPR